MPGKAPHRRVHAQTPPNSGQGIPIEPCPVCGVPVERIKIGGSVRRFCKKECRWEFHSKKRDAALRHLKASIERTEEMLAATKEAMGWN